MNEASTTPRDITAQRPTLTFDTSRYEAVWGFKPKGYALWTFQTASGIDRFEGTFADAKAYIRSRSRQMGNTGDHVIVSVLP